MTLTAYYQRNTKAAGLGFELLTSEPGAFKMCWKKASYEKPYEIAQNAMGIMGVQAIVRMRSVAR